jgi:hypothetical protein
VLGGRSPELGRETRRDAERVRVVAPFHSSSAFVVAQLLPFLTFTVVDVTAPRDPPGRGRKGRCDGARSRTERVERRRPR